MRAYGPGRRAGLHDRKGRRVSAPSRSEGVIGFAFPAPPFPRSHPLSRRTLVPEEQAVADLWSACNWNESEMNVSFMHCHGELSVGRLSPPAQSMGVLGGASISRGGGGPPLQAGTLPSADLRPISVRSPSQASSFPSVCNSSRLCNSENREATAYRGKSRGRRGAPQGNGPVHSPRQPGALGAWCGNAEEKKAPPARRGAQVHSIYRGNKGVM